MKSEDVAILTQRRDHYDGKQSDNDFVCLDYFINGIPMSEDLYDRTIRQPLIQRLELETGNDILDIGCGTGLFLDHYVKFGGRVVGTDISENILNRYKGSAETYCYAAHELDFEPESFDRISMVSVAILFPSLDYFKMVVEKCLSLLRDNGILVIGDQIVSTKEFKTQYLKIDTLDLVQYLEQTGYPYSICSHNREKRAFSPRKDIIIYKDAKS